MRPLLLWPIKRSKTKGHVTGQLVSSGGQPSRSTIASKVRVSGQCWSVATMREAARRVTIRWPANWQHSDHCDAITLMFIACDTQIFVWAPVIHGINCRMCLSREISSCDGHPVSCNGQLIHWPLSLLDLQLNAKHTSFPPKSNRTWPFCSKTTNNYKAMEPHKHHISFPLVQFSCLSR